jgi:hypothetical protein
MQTAWLPDGRARAVPAGSSPTIMTLVLAEGGVGPRSALAHFAEVHVVDPARRGFVGRFVNT